MKTRQCSRFPLWQDCLLWLELGRIQVPLCELAWAEASGHNCLLHCVHGVIRASESLSSLERRLPPFPFVRCQRSFLVNLRHVRAMGEGGFRMSGGGEVPIGQSSRAGAVQAYQAFRRRLEGAEKP